MSFASGNRSHYPEPCVNGTKPGLTVVLVSWNTEATITATLDTVPPAALDRTVETVVVDNGSSDGSVNMLRARDVELIELDRNTGFTHAANVGARAATHDLVLFLNPDVLLPAGSLDTLAGVLADNDHAWGVTPWFCNPDGSPQHFWRRLPTSTTLATDFTHRGRRIARMLGGAPIRRHRYAEFAEPPGIVPIGTVGAACLLVRRAEFLAAGAFDERFFNFFQDTDYARRMQRLGRVLLGVGSVSVSHILGVTFRTLPPTEAHIRFLDDFARYLEGEPSWRRLAGKLALGLELAFRDESWTRAADLVRAGRVP